MRMVQFFRTKQLCKSLTPGAFSFGCRKAGKVVRLSYQEESLRNLECQQAIALSCKWAAYRDFVLAHL